MELRHLRYFVAAAEEEHFGRAAMRLGIVQPALTRQVRHLETELGVGLFERIGRGVRLTPAGRIFLEDARRTVAEANRAARRAHLAASGQLGTLTVGFVEASIHSEVVPNVLAEFRKQLPDVQLELVTLRSIDQWGALRHRQVNVGILYYLPSDFPELRSELVATEHVVLALPKDHRLSRKAKVMLRDLRDEPFVWFRRTDTPPYHDHVIQACKDAGLTLKIVQEAPTESSLLSLVARGVGFSFAVESRARHQTLADVTLRQVADLKVVLSLRMVWRADDPSPVLPKFFAVLRDVQARMKPLRNRSAR
jgi:DNA-binding transcriptional LysR family regulator